MSEPEDVFHRGERAVQDRAGAGSRVRHAIRDFMPDQHRAGASPS